MRLHLLALFLCAGVTALSQSPSPTFAMPDSSPAAPHTTPASPAQVRTDCKGLLWNHSIPGFATGSAAATPPPPSTFLWEEPPLEPNVPFQSPFFNPGEQAKPPKPFQATTSGCGVQPGTLLALNGGPAIQQFQVLQMPNQILPRSLSPHAKSPAIPTQWPNLKVEQIPTQWKNLKMLPVESITPAAQPAQLK